MSAANAKRALCVKGRLCINPTIIYPGAFPHGGTELGLKESASVAWDISYHKIIAEEFGCITEVLRQGEMTVFSFVLSQWDNSILALVFPSVGTGISPSGIGGMSRIQGLARPGLVAEIGPILFSPDDPTYPGVLIHRPIPMIEESSKLNLSQKDRALFSIMLHATPNANGDTHQVDLLEHLSL